MRLPAPTALLANCVCEPVGCDTLLCVTATALLGRRAECTQVHVSFQVVILPDRALTRQLSACGENDVETIPPNQNQTVCFKRDRGVLDSRSERVRGVCLATSHPTACRVQGAAAPLFPSPHTGLLVFPPGTLT